MALYISVVNHNHDKIICENPTLQQLARTHRVILKSNTLASVKLKEYCLKSGIHLIQGKEKKGFGANNNEVYEYCQKQLNILNDDYFLVLNPDIEVKFETIEKLINNVTIDKIDIAAINLFRDREMTIYDNSIRYFPSLLNPIKSLLKIQRTDHYDKGIITTPIRVDWAAGSFLLFSSEIYRKLHGFNEKYFMYYEDADLCRRAKRCGSTIRYYPEISAIHLAQHQNRKVLSKHFYYYCISFLRYFFKS